MATINTSTNTPSKIESTEAKTCTSSETDCAKVMVVDDVPLNVKIACAHLKAAGYKNFIQVTDSKLAMTKIYEEDPDILLLDIMMPDVSGLDILQAVRADPHYAHLPILILTAAGDSQLKKQALDYGATDFLPKPIDAEELIPRVHNALMMKSYQDHLEEKVRNRTEELESSREEVIHCLARAAEYRDNETGKHVIRVSKYAKIIAEKLGFDADRVSLIEQASKLHGMGKVGIPDSVLLKPGKLTDDEYKTMQNHCEYGFMICGVAGDETSPEEKKHANFGVSLLCSYDSPLLKMASTIAATHHEKWDGSGYPMQLKGEEIPIEGRITAIADVFDALSSKRPYKEAFPLEECWAIMKQGSGKHFDAKLLELFLEEEQAVLEIRDQFAE